MACTAAALLVALAAGQAQPATWESWGGRVANEILKFVPQPVTGLVDRHPWEAGEGPVRPWTSSQYCTDRSCPWFPVLVGREWRFADAGLVKEVEALEHRAPARALEDVQEVEWIGKDLVEGPLLGRKGSLEAPALAFELVPVADVRQRARQEERLAYLASIRGRHAEAFARGREALRLDPAFSPARIESYLLVADAAVAVEDYPAAAAAYRELLGHLPSPPRDDLSLAVSERLKLLERVKP